MKEGFLQKLLSKVSYEIKFSRLKREMCGGAKPSFNNKDAASLLFRQTIDTTTSGEDALQKLIEHQVQLR